MKKRIKFMYEEGDTTALETLVTAENFSDLVNKAEYVQNVHTYDRKQLEEYVETKQQIADLKTTLEDEQKNMESMQAEYEDKESELSSTIESKKAEVADLDSQIQAAAEAAAAEALAAQRQTTTAIITIITATVITTPLEIITMRTTAIVQARAAAQATRPLHRLS